MEVPAPEQKQEEYEAGMEGEAVGEPQQAQPAASQVSAPQQAQPVQPQPAHHAAQPKENWKDKLAVFARECVRVFRITKKPDREEFTTIVKISGAGILAIGFIGFIIHLVQVLVLNK